MTAGKTRRQRKHPEMKFCLLKPGSPAVNTAGKIIGRREKYAGMDIICVVNILYYKSYTTGGLKMAGERVVVNMSMPPEFHAILNKTAGEKKISMSELLRRSFKQYIASEKRWQMIREWGSESAKRTVIVTPAESVRVIKSDNRILECALEGNADYIISGDKKHLQPLKTFRKIPIFSPAKFASSFLE